MLDRGSRECIVLTADGEFRRWPRAKGVGVGDELELGSPTRWRPYALVAALLVLCLGLTLLQWTLGRGLQVYVTMDVNPSLEFGVDARWRVQTVRGLNAEGEALANQLALRGQALEEVVSQVLAAFPSHQLVLFTLCSAADQAVPGALLDDFQQRVGAFATAERAVEAWEVSPKVRQVAESHGLSAGRMTLAWAVQERGIIVDVAEMNWGDVVQSLVKSGVNVGHLVREVARTHHGEFPEEAGELPAWVWEGGAELPPGLNKEPGQPAAPLQRPLIPPGQLKERESDGTEIQEDPGGEAETEDEEDERQGPPITPPGQQKGGG